MKIAKALCWLVILAATIHFLIALRATGTSTGLGLDAFLQAYFSNPWNAVVGVDLMLGLLLASAWIFWRETDRAAGLTWIIVMLWWGNLILAIYVLRQLSSSGGRWDWFFMGQRASDAQAAAAAPWPALVRGLLLLAALAAAAFAAWGCWSVQFSPIPSIGYVSGIGSLSLAALMMALKTGARH